MSGWTRSVSSPGGYVAADESLRVDGRDWLYAIGDVNGRALLTHMGKYRRGSRRTGSWARTCACARTEARRRA